MHFNGFTFDLTLFFIFIIVFIFIDTILGKTIFRKQEEDILDEEQKKLIAWHEAAHTLSVKHFGFNLIETNLNITKNIDSLGLGVTIIKNDKVLKNKSDIENMIKVFYSGRIGELLYLDGDTSKLTASCSDDIASSTILLEDYVHLYGYSDKYKLLSLKELSLSKHESLIEDYLSLSNRFYDEIENYLKEHKLCISMIADSLLENKKLNNVEVEKIIKKYEEENNIKI